MTLQDILKAKGVSDEDIQGILGEMKKNNIFTANEENLDIRYGKLKADHDTLTAKHGESTKLIEELKASAKDNEGMKAKFTTYEAQISQLTEQLNNAKIDAAMDRKLSKNGANPADFDYLKFQWRKKGEVKLDEDGEIKGGEDVVAALKTQCPNQFSSAEQMLEVDVQPLPENSGKRSVVTQEQFDKMGYQSRLKLHQENPEVYAQMTGKAKL